VGIPRSRSLAVLFVPFCHRVSISLPTPNWRFVALIGS